MKKLRYFPGYMMDSRNPLFKKLAVVIGIAYILWPLDLVTDFLPIVGWLDDLGVFGLLVFFMNAELGDYTRLRQHERTREPSVPKK